MSDWNLGRGKYQIDRDVQTMQTDLTRRRHVEQTRGLDPTVCYLTIKDAARHSGLTESAVKFAVKSERLAPVDHAGRQVLFHPHEVRRWILTLEEKKPC